MKMDCPICGKYADKYFMKYQVCQNCSDNLNKLREHDYTVCEYFDNYSVSSDELKSTIDVLLSEAEEKREIDEEREKIERTLQEKFDNLLVSTVGTLEGYTIEKYVDIVFGTYSFSTVYSSLFRDAVKPLTSDSGSLNAFSDEKIDLAKDEVLARIMEKTLELDANAIIGIHFDIQVGHFDKDKVMHVIVSGSGTAVQAKRKEM